MKPFAKTLALGLVLAGAAPLALASPMVLGSLTITGTVMSAGSGANFGFAFTSDPNYTDKISVSGTTNSNLAPFTTPNPVSFPSSFVLGTTGPGPQNLNGELLFTTVENGQTLTFNVTSFTNSGGGYTFLGVLSDNGATIDNATAVMSFNGSATPYGSKFTLVVTETPEPSSLILLGTGLLGAVGLMARKRRVVTA